jgi:flagellar motor switch protein FliM
VSTKDILSEDELDALMDSVSSSGTPLDDGSASVDYEPFDFNTREQALVAQMPALKTLNEKQCLAMTHSIQEFFKIPADIEVVDIQLIKLDQAIAGIPSPSGINLVKIAPLNGLSFVVLSGELLSFFVELYFGGAADHSSSGIARETLTPTERRVNDVLTEKFLSTLKDAWVEKISLTPTLTSFETNPEYLQAGSMEEPALLFPFVIKVGEWQASIDWIVPYATIEPLKPKLGNPANVDLKTKKNGASWEAYFRSVLGEVEIEVNALFTSKNSSISEVLKLKSGSIVPLKTPTEVTLCVEGQPFSAGEHGALNGNKSIKITKVYQQ